MPPYNHLKVVHDQQIQEALERRRLSAEQETPRQGLLQTLGKVLARRSGAKPATDCTGIEELPDTILEDLRKLIPREYATFEECDEERDAACA